METVKIEKQKLTVMVRANRINHRDAFEKAFEGYKTECIQILEKNLEEFKKGNRTRIQFNEVAPQDHTGDYDRVLLMMEMSVDNVIELTQQEFQWYVQDDWAWKQGWSMSNMKYLQK